MGNPGINNMLEKKQIRCGKCNKLLAKGMAGNIEIKCPRCRAINHVRAESPSSELPDGQDGATHAYSQEKINN